jgi:hypothetical protein
MSVFLMARLRRQYMDVTGNTYSKWQCFFISSRPHLSFNIRTHTANGSNDIHFEPIEQHGPMHTNLVYMTY